MPFKAIKKFGKKKKKKTVDVLKDVHGMQTREEVSDIVFSIIKNRRMIRRYLNKDVSQILIKQLLEAARYAPSAGNHQPWEFIVVRDKKTQKDLVSAAFNQEWMLEAPVFIVACINMRLAGAVYGERGLKLYGIQDVAAAIENMLLAATSLGLGVCWVGAFSEYEVSMIMRCPDYVRPCAIITVGWPAERPKERELQPLEEIAHKEFFGQTYQLERIIKEKKPGYIKIK